MYDEEICTALVKCEDKIQEQSPPSICRPGSPEPPRGESGATPFCGKWGNFILDKAEEEDQGSELFQECALELHGFGTPTQGSGYYEQGKHSGRFPKSAKIGLINSEHSPSGFGPYKICTTEPENVAATIQAIIAPEIHALSLTDNPPMGSWHLFVENFAVLDREDRNEIRIDLEPGDGLTSAGTSVNFTPTSVYVVTELADHPKKGTRKWSFALSTFAPIHPDTSSVTLLTKKKLFIRLIKAQRALWDQGPGTLYAPVTKSNYRSFHPHGPKPFPPLPQQFSLF